MSSRADKHLSQIETAGRNVQAFIAGKSRSDYDRDLLLRSAVERQLEILGEAVRRLRDDEPALVTKLSHWRLIIGFRNALAQGYDSKRLMIDF
jgi:uncharacterized protein with HEPN domain